MVFFVSTKFTANQFRLFLHSMAYILTHTLQKQVLKGTEYSKKTMKTIQNKFIKTAEWVKEIKTIIKIELNSVDCSLNQTIIYDMNANKSFSNSLT